jgi:hypothetical protein
VKLRLRNSVIPCFQEKLREESLIETCSAPTPGLAGTRCKNPKRERGSLRRSSRLLATDTPRSRVPARACTSRSKLVGGVLPGAGHRRERVTLEGNKAQGRLESDRSFGRQGTTDFRGAPGRRARICQARVGRSVRANARQAGCAERYRPCRGRGTLRRANPKSVAA